MFKRRQQQTIVDRARAVLWPSMGWLRAIAYFIQRIKRMSGTPHAIAAGLACGAAVSFTPFIGLHFGLAALLAWMIGGNLLASALGTAVGNPWTFPLIWIGIYRLGHYILGWDPGHHLPEPLSMTYIFENPAAILLPMSIGAVPVVIVVWIVVYVTVRWLVADYQAIREKRRERKRKRAAASAAEKETAI